MAIRLPVAFTSPCPLSKPQRRAHNAEKSAHISCTARPKLDTTVYVVTDRELAGSRGALWAVERALAGDGKDRRATIVQLRDKHANFPDAVKLGRALRDATRRAGALLIVNDSLELAKAVDADGLHLGQNDAAAREMRAHVRVLGVSAGTCEEAERAIGDGADYVGVGSVFATSTKVDAREPIGVDGLADIVSVVSGRIPVVAIGGIASTNAEECAAAGADGVAVVSAVMAVSDPAMAAAELVDAVERGRLRARG